MAGTDAPKRECDLVMRGGITSGMVYPRAIAKLSETYNFRSMGGISAGAIAAAGTAAAAYGAKHGKNHFDKRFRDLPEELSEKKGVGENLYAEYELVRDRLGGTLQSVRGDQRVLQRLFDTRAMGRHRAYGMPGYRDRIVHVALAEDEGGLTQYAEGDHRADRRAGREGGELLARVRAQSGARPAERQEDLADLGQSSLGRSSFMAALRMLCGASAVAGSGPLRREPSIL